MIGRGDLDVAAGAALGHYTHEKSSVGCAAALATLDIIEEEQLIARSGRLGEAGMQQLRAGLGGHRAVRDIRKAGLYFGVELHSHGGVSSQALADRVLYRCLSDGLSFKTGGGNVLTLCPPLTIAESDLSAALDIVIQNVIAAADGD